MCCAVLSCLVMSSSLQPHGLQPARLLSSWRFSRQGHWSGLPCPAPGDLPNPRFKSRSLALQADSLPSEPAGKPKIQIHDASKLYTGERFVESTAYIDGLEAIEHEKLIDMVQDSTLQLISKKITLVEFWCTIKKIPKLSEKVTKISLPFPTICIYMRPDLLHIFK